MTRSLSRFQAILLGLVIFTGLILGAVGLFAAGSRQWFSDSFSVQAGFSHVEGVDVGTRVFIRGIDAGEVESIESTDTPGKEVMLHLRLEGKVRKWVKSDSTIQITQPSLFSAKIVRILPGQSGEDVEDGVELASLPPVDLTQNLEQASTHLNTSLADFQQGKGPIGTVTNDLNQVTTRLKGVLAKADSALEDVKEGKGTVGKLLQDEKLYDEMMLAMKKVNNVFDEFQEMKGKFTTLYNQTDATVKEAKEMVVSVKQNSDAVKAMPIVRSYVVDANKELNRPDFQRFRQYFEEARLFEPGKAMLTDEGRRTLDAVARWANDRKEEGSEVVVASFADTKYPSGFAKTLTDKQSEVVVNYLRDQHKIHSTGWLPWSYRTVKSLGCGNSPTPVPGDEKLPAARIEVIIFVPHNG